MAAGGRVRTYVSRAMRQLIAARSWLTVFQLSAYAPQLNPVEGLCQVEEFAGQPDQAEPRPAYRAQDPAQADALRAPPDRGFLAKIGLGLTLRNLHD